MKNWAVWTAWLLLTFPLASQTGTVGTPGSGLEQGETYFQAGDFQAALITFQKILSDPRQKAAHPDALFWTGKTYLVLGDLSKALEALDSFLRENPSHSLVPEGVYTRARVLLAQGEYERSLREFAAFAENYGENSFTPNTLFWMGEGAYFLARYQEARTLYKRLLELYPTSSKAEAAGYRLSVVDLKLREEELLNMLQWSHQESVNAYDEYRRKELAYEKRLKEYEEEIRKLKSSDVNLSRIAELEAQVRELKGTVRTGDTTASTLPEGMQRDRLLQLKQQALELKALYLEWERKHGM